LEPEHLSVYALTLEKGTALERWVRRGLISEPDADLAADMYEWASERLAANQYAQYEISNWARIRHEKHWKSYNSKETFACRHNLQYWRNLPYLGFGAGAHGYIENLRTANLNSPLAYIQALSAVEHGGLKNFVPQDSQVGPSHRQDWLHRGFPATPATQDIQLIDRSNEMAETMMMGLRLTQEGVSQKIFSQRFGQTLLESYGTQIERLIRTGLLEWAGNRHTVLRLTSKGRLLGNRVFMEFL
jgi:coproporphyrinogen III oxidase-like Fe-S oxidoreductase